LRRIAGNAANAAPLPLIDEMDLSIQCNPQFLRPTVAKIVNNQAAATNTRLPLGLVCKPMAGDVGTENEGEFCPYFVISGYFHHVCRSATLSATE
jgi:hypothetical protein